jgi:hypothetical protein
VPQNPSYPPRSAFTEPIIEAASSYSMVLAACAETAASEATALAIAASEAKPFAEVLHEPQELLIAGDAILGGHQASTYGGAAASSHKLFRKKLLVG